jgi:hypothetical protein
MQRHIRNGARFSKRIFNSLTVVAVDCSILSQRGFNADLTTGALPNKVVVIEFCKECMGGFLCKLKISHARNNSPNG